MWKIKNLQSLANSVGPANNNSVECDSVTVTQKLREPDSCQESFIFREWNLCHRAL